VRPSLCRGPNCVVTAVSDEQNGASFRNVNEKPKTMGNVHNNRPVYCDTVIQHFRYLDIANNVSLIFSPTYYCVSFITGKTFPCLC
jgi:hypothetical protein